MHLKNENETREAIEGWRSASPATQLGRLRKAIETMELDQMHYEQRENTRGIGRCETCLALLQQRLAEIEHA